MIPRTLLLTLTFTLGTALGSGPAQAASCGIFGLTVPNPQVLVALEKKAGCTFQHVRWFQDWNQPFNQEYARLLSQKGRTLDLSWQPRYVSKGKLVGVPYRDIAAGKHDRFITQFARDIKRGGKTVSISFAPEMNGDWGVYQLTSKNTPAHFKQAWKRLVHIFWREKAPVRWVWTPNILYPTALSSYRELYPGDGYVNEIGLDGYNWGTTNPWNRWKTFAQTFDESYVAIKQITSKPMQLGELSSVEKGGDKAQWILDACRQLPKYARVKKAFWFHINDGRVDWRLTTSLASLQAFRRCAPGTALK